MIRAGIVIVGLALAGCGQLFGLDAPIQAELDDANPGAPWKSVVVVRVRHEDR